MRLGVMLDGQIAFRGLNGRTTEKAFFHALVETIGMCGCTFVLYVKDVPDSISRPFWEQMAQQCGAHVIWNDPVCLQEVEEWIVFSTSYPVLSPSLGERRYGIVVNPHGRALSALEAAHYDNGTCSRLEGGDGAIEIFRLFSAPCYPPFLSRAPFSQAFPHAFASVFRENLKGRGLAVYE